MKLIGVVGVAGSGKTLVAKYLIEQHGFVRRRFAEPLKNMLRVGLGLTDAQLEGSEKMAQLPAFGGCTPRHIMQTLGTEWGRRMIHSDIWVNAWKRSLIDAGDLIVVDDVRFPNEASVIQAMGGTLWRVYRPGLVTHDHASERHQQSIVEDFLLNNATSIADLMRSVELLIHTPGVPLAA